VLYVCDRSFYNNAMIRCSTLYYIAHFCLTLLHTTWHHTKTHCNILFHFAKHLCALHMLLKHESHTSLPYSVTHDMTPHCNALQHNVQFCNTLVRVAHASKTRVTQKKHRLSSASSTQLKKKLKKQHLLTRTEFVFSFRVQQIYKKHALNSCFLFVWDRFIKSTYWIRDFFSCGIDS